MSDVPPPPTVEYATPARETRRSSRTLLVVLLVGLIVLAAVAGALSYLLLARSQVSVQVIPATVAPGTPAPRGPPTLSLPSDPLRLTMRQREVRPLPGSKDSIFLHVDDVTRGQVLISLIAAATGTPVLNSTSVRPGDSATFPVGGQTYVIDVLELQNTLTSGDFVVLSIATPGKRPKTTTAPATAPAR